MLDFVFNLDSRIIRTSLALFVPGKLTLDFFAGRRARYYHPLRLFVVTGIALLAVAAWRVPEDDLRQLDSRWQSELERFFQLSTVHTLDSLSESLPDSVAGPAFAKAFDTLAQRFIASRNLTQADSMEINTGVAFVSSKSTLHPRTVKVATRDLIELPRQQILDKYRIAGFWQRLFFIQNVRFLQAGSQLVFYAIGNLLWMAIVMMPLLALGLKILYIRRDVYFVEHLVFLLHTHAFSFLLVTLGMLSAGLFDIQLGCLLALALAVYIAFAMKRFYGQGWPKTLLKFVLIDGYYFILFGLLFVLTALASFLLF